VGKTAERCWVGEGKEVACGAVMRCIAMVEGREGTVGGDVAWARARSSAQASRHYFAVASGVVGVPAARMGCHWVASNVTSADPHLATIFASPVHLSDMPS
jgi:hypothetical protein